MTKKKKLAARLMEKEYGSLPSGMYRHIKEAASGYFRHHMSGFQIDDITWNDLDMDKVYERMDYTKSAAGSEVLYNFLRTPCFDKEELEHRHMIAEAVSDDSKIRTELSYLFMGIGNTGKYSLSDYLDYLEQVEMKSNVPQILVDLLYIPVIALLFYKPEIAVVLLFFLICFSIMTYFSKKGKISAYLVSFAYILRMIKGAKLLIKKSYPFLEKEQTELKESIRKLESFRRFSGIAMSMNNPMGSSDPFDVVIDYIRMIFHIDIMKFYQMLNTVKKYRTDIEHMFYLMGYIDACMSIAFYRASLTACCTPDFRSDTDENGVMDIENVYHPLLDHPVCNSITIKQGVLLTGSNASGKSTFLKTMAINAILSQSIYTCLADRWHALFVKTMSSMALKDDVVQGQSYFMVEIKALKRILDECRQSDKRVLCIVDEVLRGTNTVERIAAACQIMKTLQNDNTICLAATHDIELTELLEGQYDNYHFEETIEDDDIRFHYELKEGPATTRNAIKLLQMLGYQEDITKAAEEMAETFFKDGKWK